MSNFRAAYEKGQRGENKGLSMGPGLPTLNRALNGVQKGRVYTIAAPSKAGKSTLVDYAFIVQPYLESLETGKKIDWIYFSFEMSRIDKEFDFAAYFLYHDYGIETVILPEGVKREGSSVIQLSSNYLRGRMLDDNDKVILVNKDIEEKLIQVYENRIVPLFGAYNEDGEQIQEGVMTFIEERDNPTGLYKYLKAKAEREGKFIKKKWKGGERIIGYKPNNSEKYVIIVTDHLRKLVLERGFQMKQNVDKFSEYSVILKNLCNYTFVHIIHLNRSLSDERRIAAAGDLLYPNSDDIKDTGNLSEDSDYVLTMFNPNDERYRLTHHFGLQIRDKKGAEIYPGIRTIHLVESRHCEFPQHFRTEMFGAFKNFSRLTIDNE
jgi:hypothetical protein